MFNFNRLHFLFFLSSFLFFFVTTFGLGRHGGRPLQFLLNPRPSVLSATSEYNVTQSATVGGSLLEYSLFGYTSSRATVTLDGLGVSQQAKADTAGRFEFNHFLAPKNTSEFCLTTIDTENLTAPPLCIPVPLTTDNKKYGPFLLPPTILVSSGNVKTGEQATVTGKTIPGTSVDISVFNVQDVRASGLGGHGGPPLQIIQSAFAASPQTSNVQRLTSNTDGSYSSTLATTNEGQVRLFARSDFKGQKTPKSFTLTVNILAAWFAFFTVLLNALKNLITFNNIIILQILILVALAINRIKWFCVQQKHRREIVLYREHELLVPEPHAIKKADNYCSLY